MLETPVGKVPRVSSQLTFADRLGAFKSRWGISRMSYAIPPGLYALGEPEAGSHVLVTSNYKLTFDKLRCSLPDRNLWILVLDTVGINVWCAAGKGTFGTEELVQRAAMCKLSEVVDHRRLILPQLGAPGVAAHVVKKQSGFKVTYGPILADDLPAFLDAGLKATPEMRRKRFPISERVVLLPVELVSALKATIIISAVFFFLGGIGGPSDYWTNVMGSGLLAVLALSGALLGGAILTPLLLPWLPGRAFSLKSLPIGLALAALVILWRGGSLVEWSTLLEAGAWLLLVPSLTAFLAMNFTGASTYTSLSGVRKEMRIAVPAQMAGASVGLVLWIVSRITA
ncbi:MAG: acetyl-CoA synthase subunit gamma [Proteobacteria bacterium]|nr:acetyl-CoA synthase subunit gamma [Pseudomonadota bacterium]